MHIILTICSGVILCACAWAYVRAQYEADQASTFARSTLNDVLTIKGQADRVTVLERELDALRRELRKLSGKFYASQRADVPIPDDGASITAVEFIGRPCDNWSIAQAEGPTSKSAACECQYCTWMRAQRARARLDAANGGKLNVNYALRNRGSVVDRNDGE